MLGLKHKIVFGVWLEEPGERLPADVLVEAITQQFLKVGLSVAKIVIDINTRNPSALGSAFQGRELCGHGQGMFEQGFAVRKVEIINDINEEQGNGGRIRRIVM